MSACVSERVRVVTVEKQDMVCSFGSMKKECCSKNKQVGAEERERERDGGMVE